MKENNQQERLSASRKLLDRIRQQGEPSLAGLESPEKKRFSFFSDGKVDSIGMEVISSGVVFARVRLSSRPVLKGIRFFPFPKGCAAGSEEAARFISRSALAFAPDISRCRLWFSAPSGLAELHFLRLPKTAGKNLDAIALLAAKKDHDFDLTSCTFDYCIEGEITEKGVQRLLALGLHAETAKLEQARSAFSFHGLLPFGITEHSLAARSVFHSKWISSPWKNFVLVTIMDESTTCCFFRDASLLMRRTLRTGLRHLSEEYSSAESAPSFPFLEEDAVYDLDSALSAESAPLTDLSWSIPGLSSPSKHEDSHPSPADEHTFFSLSSPSLPSSVLAALQSSESDPAAPSPAPAPASLRKDDYGPLYGSPSKEEEDLLRQRLTPPLERMGRQLERTAEWFKNTINSDGTEGILLICPKGISSLACTIFASETNLPCFPFMPLGESSPEASAEMARLFHSPRYEGAFRAISLALSSRSTPNLLIPPALRRKVAIYRRIAGGIGAAGMILGLALGALGLSSFFDWQQNRQELALLERQRAAWKEEYTVETMQKEMESLRAVHKKGVALASRRLPAAVIPCLADITPESIHILSMNISAYQPAKGEKGSGGHTIVIQGVAFGEELQRETDLAGFFRRLESTPMFTSVSVSRNGNESFTATLKAL